MRRNLLIIVGAAMLAVLAVLSFRLRHTPVRLGGETFYVEVAATAAARARGLSGRRSLAPGRGLLLQFPTADRHGIWMKDMRFPIDIFWLAAGGERRSAIVDVAPGVPAPSPGTPDAELRIYYPRLPADQVLELPAGTAHRFNVTIGAAVQF